MILAMTCNKKKQGSRTHSRAVPCTTTYPCLSPRDRRTRAINQQRAALLARGSTPKSRPRNIVPQLHNRRAHWAAWRVVGYAARHVPTDSRVPWDPDTLNICLRLSSAAIGCASDARLLRDAAERRDAPAISAENCNDIRPVTSIRLARGLLGDVFPILNSPSFGLRIRFGH